MTLEVPPDSQLAREIELAEEAEIQTAAKLRADLLILTKMADATSTPQKPTPTPELEAPPEFKKVTPKPTPKKSTTSKKVDNAKTPIKQKPITNSTNDDQTPKKEARVGLNKRLSDWANTSQAVDLLAPASDNFVKQLLKLRKAPWEQVHEKLVEVRQARVAAARETGNSIMPNWQPADIDRTAEALDCPTTSTKSKATKRKASASPSPSTVKAVSSIEDHGSPKKRKTIQPAMTQQPPPPLSAPFAEMRFEPRKDLKDEQAELPHLPDDTWEELVNYSPKTPANDETHEAGASKQVLAEAGARAHGLDHNDDQVDDTRMNRDILGAGHESDDQVQFAPIAPDQNHHASQTLEPAQAAHLQHDQDQREPEPTNSSVVDATKFINCLTRLSEASSAKWHVWNPHDDDNYAVPGVGGLFVPLLVPNSTGHSDWVLLALEANRRWAKVYTSTSSPDPALRERVKAVVSGLQLCNVAPKIIFPEPIYQGDTDNHLDGTLVLLVSACYRAAGFDIPDVVEDLSAWRLVVTDMLVPDGQGTINSQPDLKLEDKFSTLYRLANDVRKSIKLEQSLAASLASSDLPDTPIATCAQVFSKLASNFQAPKEIQDRMEYIAHTVASAGDAAARGASERGGVEAAVDGLLKALGEGEKTG